MTNSYDDMMGENEDVSDHKFTSSDPVHMASDDVPRLPVIPSPSLQPMESEQIEVSLGRGKLVKPMKWNSFPKDSK